MKTLTTTIAKKWMFIVFAALFMSCEKDDSLAILELEDQAKKEKFNFDQFGKTHNAYLEYVWNFDERKDPEARFNYGKSFEDDTFGSFDTPLTYQDLEKSMPMHKQRIDQIMKGNYRAENEGLSKEMTAFLNTLAKKVKESIDNKYTMGEFAMMIAEIEDEVLISYKVEIDLEKGVSNDAASMLAISSILKYSVKYWMVFDNGDGADGDDIPMAKGGIGRAIADAWGYVSAWVDNGDGSYSWDHESALVNADCVSDKVREN